MSSTERAGDPSGGMLDAADFLRFNERLRETHQRLDAADLPREQKRRWQRRLIGIADAGARDLATARDQLGRLVSELDRRL